MIQHYMIILLMIITLILVSITILLLLLLLLVILVGEGPEGHSIRPHHIVVLHVSIHAYVFL